MALTLQDLVDNPALLEMLRKVDTCPKCFKPFRSYEASYTIDGVRVCDDCYFGAIGELVERHPICSGIRRG